jgi:hypothetical protein
MAEKPIIFSTPMVQAILDGRKTQTRRVVKPQPEQGMKIIGPEWFEPTVIDGHGEEEPGKPIFGIYADIDDWGLKAPYQPGDILWVRETWQPLVNSDGITVGYHYFTGQVVWIKEELILNIQEPLKWKPSIHMPREAARIFLKVKDVRVERVQDISRWDVNAEGCPFRCESDDGMPEKQLKWFANLWDSLNAKRGYSWDSNPWVWVIEFERVEVQS